MDYKSLIRHFKTQQLAANALGLDQSTISGWRSGIPLLRQYQIQVVTSGKLRAKRPNGKAAA